ncbi:MAG: hypothetical protein ACXVHO_09580 [Methanobacterium sp.]
MDRYQSSVLLLTGVALGFTDDATVGYTTMDADLFSSHKCYYDPKWVDESISTIVIDPKPVGPPASGEPEGSNVAAAAGGEVALAFLALSMIGGGLVSAKMK